MHLWPFQCFFRKEVMDLVNKSGKFTKVFASFTGTNDPLGKRLNNSKTRAEIGWEPKYPSFSQFLDSLWTTGNLYLHCCVEVLVTKAQGMFAMELLSILFAYFGNTCRIGLYVRRELSILKLFKQPPFKRSVCFEYFTSCIFVLCTGSLYIIGSKFSISPMYDFSFRVYNLLLHQIYLDCSINN